MKLQDIERLARTGKELKAFLTERLPKVRSKANGIDKHSDGFGVGCDEIQSMNIKLHYSSFSGVYGDSSTYSDIAGINADIMKDYFIKYLNKYKDEIIAEMTSMMIKDAQESKEEALKELEERKQNLLKLLND